MCSYQNLKELPRAQKKYNEEHGLGDQVSICHGFSSVDVIKFQEKSNLKKEVVIIILTRV